MSDIVAFNFFAGESEEPIQIRSICNAQGDPWFVLRDLLTGMGTSTTVTSAIESVIQGLGKGFTNDIPLQTAGGVQQTVIVAEAAATYLVSRSNTEQGRKLNRFVHVDVLPQIRRTGRYRPPVSAPETSQTLALEMLHALTWRDASEQYRNMCWAVEQMARSVGITDYPTTCRMKAKEAELLNLTILGMTSREFSNWYEARRPIREHMQPVQLLAYTFLEEQNTLLINAGMDYSTRAALLENMLTQRYPACVTYRNAQLKTIHERTVVGNLKVRPVAPKEFAGLQVSGLLEAVRNPAVQ